MRYQLTDEELLVIHQDQVDTNLREIESLHAEMARAVPDSQAEELGISIAGTESGVKARLAVVQAAHEETVKKAKATEARVKAKK